MFELEDTTYLGKAVPSQGGGTVINNQDVTVTPSTSSQTLNVPEGYTGYGTISVNAVTSDIDENIKAANIKEGIAILGIEGEYTPELQEKTFNKNGEYTADAGYAGFSKVIVNTPSSVLELDKFIVPKNIVFDGTHYDYSDIDNVTKFESGMNNIITLPSSPIVPSNLVYGEV